MHSSEPKISQVIILAFFILFLLLKKKSSTLNKHQLSILIIFSLLAISTYFNLFQFHAGNRYIHTSDFYHYYIGTKYFNELGYFGLYNATVVADIEDDREGYNPDAKVRYLKDHSLSVCRSYLFEHNEEVKKNFSEERWAEFKKDISAFRNIDIEVWRKADYLNDHGYNGTPLTTFILGGVANLSIDISIAMKIFPGLDIIMLACLIIALIVATSPNSAFLFLFFFAINPFNQFAFIGGSFLRYSYYYALVLGLFFFNKNKPIISSFFFSISFLFQIFPVLFVVPVFLKHAISSNRISLIKKNMSFYSGLAVSTILILGLTSSFETRMDENAWYHFFQRITRYHGEGL